jgi:hypothetical protein
MCYAGLQHRLSLDVAHWHRRWILWTAICLISGSGLSPTHCQPFCFSSLCLLKVCAKISSLPLPLSLVLSEHPAPSAACSFSVPCLLFSFVFLWGRGQSVQGAMLVYRRGGCGYTVCHWFAHLLVASPKQVWSQHLMVLEPSCFLHVTWYGETLYGLGFRVSEFCFFLVFFFCQVWLQHLSKTFYLQSSCWLLLPSNHHLGSTLSILSKLLSHLSSIEEVIACVY